jgi:signal peptidase II
VGSVGEVAVFGRSAQDDAESAAPVAPARSRRAVALLVVAAAGVLTADIVSKIVAVAQLSNRAPVTLVPHVLDLELTRNAGAAFSMAGGATILFSLVAVAVVAVIARTARGLRSRAWAVVLGLLLGGALGNLSDRIFRAPAPLRGHVVDWIHLHHWPVFNLADSAIVVGAVIAVILSAWGIGIDGQHAGDGRGAGPHQGGAGDGGVREVGGDRPGLVEHPDDADVDVDGDGRA